MMGKSLVAASGLCLQLDPDLNILELVRPRLTRLIAKRLSPPRLAKGAAFSAWQLFNTLRSTPGLLRDVFRRLATGKWQVNIRHQNLRDLAIEVDRASNRLGFAIVIASIILSSSMIITSEGSLPLLDLPLAVLGMVGYIVAGLMGFWLVIGILRSGKLS
jgi:ubiquinone biosynthesis protein